MAKKKSGPKISELLGLDWQVQEPETPEESDYCHFCDGAIYANEKYFWGVARGGIYAGDALFTACLKCAKEAGLSW